MNINAYDHKKQSNHHNLTVLSIYLTRSFSGKISYYINIYLTIFGQLFI